MAITSTKNARIRAVTSCVPGKKFDNLEDASEFSKEEVQKVVRMAGVKTRYLADDTVCSSDLCLAAAKDVLRKLNWEPESVDALIFVTQSPDYFLPSTACLIHRDLGLASNCTAFDVGLGCSGYPYGIWLASMMLQGPGFSRVLVLHGETPTRFSNKSDRAVALLFGDAGSATALEKGDGESEWHFCLHTDGSGYGDLIIEGGGFRDRFPENRSDCYVRMNGGNIFNFTIKRIPSLIEDTLSASGLEKDDIDYYIFHQSNRFIMNHLIKKVGLPKNKTPMTIENYGSAGGPSVPLTLTQGGVDFGSRDSLKFMLLGYGVGLSWGSALVDMPSDCSINHLILDR